MMLGPLYIEYVRNDVPCPLPALSFARLLTASPNRWSSSRTPQPTRSHIPAAMDAFTDSFDVGQWARWATFVGGCNLAIVGLAGCGKSRTLLSCIAHVRRRYATHAVLFMAWTWAAAVQIVGQSYVSYLGMSTSISSQQQTLAVLMFKPCV